MKLNKPLLIMSLFVFGPVVTLICALMLLQGASPELRHLKTDIPAHPAAKSYAYQQYMLHAEKHLEELNKRLPEVLASQSTGILLQWWSGSVWWDSTAQFELDLKSHLGALTQVLSVRRQWQGPWPALKDFELKNTLRQSDFILSLEVVKPLLQNLQSTSVWQQYMEERKWAAKPLQITAVPKIPPATSREIYIGEHRE